MSKRRRERIVRLDDLDAVQLAIVREGAEDFLVAKAEDLRLLHTEENPGQAVREVAALGRLTAGLRHAAISVPDREVRGLVAKRTTETRYLEEVKEAYETELAENEAWVALLAHFLRKHEGSRPAISIRSRPRGAIR